MTLAEALTELGIQRGAESDQVRRAYLRLIKIRKPETDPAGFQRVREAYDLVRSLGPTAKLLASNGEEISGERAAETHRLFLSMGPTEFSASSSRSRETESEAGPSAESSQKHADKIAMEGFVRAWNAVPPSDGMAPRLEIAREAVAAQPTEARAHWLLVRTLSVGITTDREVAEALRGGWRAAGSAFLEELLVRLPRMASPEEVEAGLRADNVFLRLAAAAGLAPREPGRASAAVSEVIQAMTEDDMFHLERVLNVILTLFKNDDPRPALAAQSVLRARIKEYGKEVEIVGGSLGAVWILAEELAALPPDFPAPLRREFAAATQFGEMDNVTSWIVAEARIHRRHVRRWRKSLGFRTPNIASLMDAGLKASGAIGRNVAVFRMGTVGRLFLTALLLSSVRTCCTYFWPSDRPVPQDSAVYIRDMQDDAAKLCVAPTFPDFQMPCEKVNLLSTAVSDGKCGSAGLAFREARDSIQDRNPSRLEARFLTDSAAAIKRVCPHTRIDRIVPRESAQ